MKKLILGVSLLIASSGLMAQTESIEQQMLVTQDTVRYFVDDLFRRSSSSSLKLTDYRKWEESYKQDMEENFVHFEQEVKSRVFGPLLEIVGRYKSVYEDKNIAFSQKKLLLGSIVTQIDSMVPGIEKEYASLLQKLYFSHNLLPKSLQVVGETYYNSRGREISRPHKKGTTVASLKPEYHRSNSTDINLERNRETDFYYVISAEGEGYYNTEYVAYNMTANHSSNWKYLKRDVDYPNLKIQQAHEKYKNISPFAFALSIAPYKFTHQRMIRGCQSKSCVLLKTSDAVYVMQSVKSMLDKEISIKIPTTDRTEKVITIKNPNINVSQFINVLSRTDFPNEVESLPFDI